MAMTEATREVGVVLRRRSIDNPWIDHTWSPTAILDEVPAITRMVVMVQREVGERLAAAVGDPAYGAVSVKVAFG